MILTSRRLRSCIRSSRSMSEKCCTAGSTEPSRPPIRMTPKRSSFSKAWPRASATRLVEFDLLAQFSGRDCLNVESRRWKKFELDPMTFLACSTTAVRSFSRVCSTCCSMSSTPTSSKVDLAFGLMSAHFLRQMSVALSQRSSSPNDMSDSNGGAMESNISFSKLLRTVRRTRSRATTKQVSMSSWKRSCSALTTLRQDSNRSERSNFVRLSNCSRQRSRSVGSSLA
mmetsp:Transcript_3157/g.9629  ORF Transcript_3157/g.9629 Transcript_3157/m.9629 type:complete len:227 (-) Transcript_3157:1207-1887(-)